MRKKAFLLTVILVMGLRAGDRVFTLENSRVKLEVLFHKGLLVRETLYDKNSGSKISTSGGFALDVMWTGWRPPSMSNNSENPVIFTEKDFVLERSQKRVSSRTKKLVLFLTAEDKDNPIKVVLEYSLKKGDFFIRRRLGVFDPVFGLHFLRRFLVYKTEIRVPGTVVKIGGYGQPVAVKMQKAGSFWGLEYPAGENRIEGDKLTLYHYVGEKITSSILWSEPAVWSITPDGRVKYWFFRYLNRIRVAPLRPYLLYNTWYDLRAPEMVDSPKNVLNEKNVRRIIELFREKMTKPFGITLDAFVLDDGWDDYRSDWRLSRKRFPGGLKSISALLSKTGTRLGMWFGPIGGYSHRDWRVSWMKAHGYETVGDQLCLGGKHYGELFRKRVLEFIHLYGVGYYKWDGFQFSCSEPDHGHPVGIYSRRAILGRLIEIVKEVRKRNPDIFLNITSGTWLSPWWLLYANTIWMQGYDYGYAAVPSISKRDRAMTYRDYVLYDDFRKKDFWFPIANLMTHGIIKGHLQKLGGEKEPIDKFTDNAVLYFARGISMYELYISPDLLTPQEWEAIAKSVKWAKDRFDVLTHHSEMIGGDPGKGVAYGYVHLKNRRGIIALRNPDIRPQSIAIKLDPEAGISREAKGLVLERVYPDRWISPELYSAGDTVNISLYGYETAVYEIYPLEKAKIPLLADAEFTLKKMGERTLGVEVYRTGDRFSILNPDMVASMSMGSRKLSPRNLPVLHRKGAEVHWHLFKEKKGFTVKINLGKSTVGGIVAVLVKSRGKPLPSVGFLLDGKIVKAQAVKQKNSWAWYRLSLSKGKHRVTVRYEDRAEISPWLIYYEKTAPLRITLKTSYPVKLRPMLPRPYPSGVSPHFVKLR